MSAIIVTVALLLLVLGSGVVRERARARNHILAFRLLVGAASVAAASAGVWGVIPVPSAIIPALWLFGGVMSSGLALGEGKLAEQLPGLLTSAGPLAAAFILLQISPPPAEVPFVMDGLQAGLMIACGGLLALALGFMLRASERLEGARVDFAAASIPLACAAMAGLAFGRLSSLSPEPRVAALPVVGADGQPVLWMADIGAGIAASAPQQDLGFLILVGAVTLIGAALLPARASAALAAVVGGGLLLGAAGWILSLHGLDVDLTAQAKEVVQSIARVGSEQARAVEPRISGTPPVSVAAQLAGLSLALLVTGGLGGLGAGLSRWWSRPPRQPLGALDVALHTLAARDAFQIATLCSWLALALWLFQTRQTTGIWGLSAAADFLLAGAAFALTAMLLVLHGAGAAPRPFYKVLRGVVVAVGIAALLAAAIGGFVSGVGLFEL